MSIKPWIERREDKHGKLTMNNEARMKAEIDELRAALAERDARMHEIATDWQVAQAKLKERDAEIQRQYVCIASHARITQAAEAKVEEQRKVLEAALYALEYAADMTKPEGMSGCDCPICTTIPQLQAALEKS